METPRQQLISQLHHALYMVEQPHVEEYDPVCFTIGKIEFKLDNTVLGTPVYNDNRDSHINREKIMETPYLIGQRVILNGTEIGTVARSESGYTNKNGIWVMSPSRGYSSEYALCNVAPLPNGQL